MTSSPKPSQEPPGQHRVCVVGFGEMGKRHAKDLEAFTNGRIRIAGVCEPSDPRYAAGCEWLGHEPARFASIDAMLREVDPHGAVIATPNSRHLETLRAFAGEALPLILEKPLDTTLAKVRQVVAFADTYQAPILVHHVMRFAPIVQRAKQLIQSGAIGELAGFQLTQNMGGHMFHNFRRSFATGGGQLLEKATHDFDVLLYLTGRQPTRVGALCRRNRYGGDKPNDLRCRACEEREQCPDSAIASHANHHDTRTRDDLCVYAREVDIFDNEHCLIELEGDVVGTYSQCFFGHAPYARRYEFHGTNGYLSIDFSRRELFLQTREGEKTETVDYHGHIHYNGGPSMVAHFLALLDGQTTEVQAPVNEAVAAELISLAAYRSNKLGNMVDIADIAPLPTRVTKPGEHHLVH